MSTLNFIHPKSEIRLIEETHTYVLGEDPTFKFTSATTFLHKFFHDFDGPSVAAKLIRTIPKYRDRTVPDLLAEWADVGATGTIIHKELEDYILYKTPVKNPKAKFGQAWLDRLNKNDQYEFYTEVILYWKELGICGTIDLLIRDKKTGMLHIADWKTNRRISQKSYDGKTGKHLATRHLQDSNYYHYTLQLSLYKFLLEEHYGQKVGWLKIVHLTDGGEVEYKCDYLKRTIANTLSTLGTDRFPKNRIIISGSREYDDEATIKQNLDRILQSFNRESTVIFEGGCRGVDKLAKIYCQENGWNYKTFMADWDTHGKAAGMMRNKQMADLASHLIAFHGGTPGTAGMIAMAKQLNIPTVIIPIKIQSPALSEVL